MRAEFRSWLVRQGHTERSAGTRESHAARVEHYHGDLDDHHERDGLEGLMRLFTYSVDDQRSSRPNPTRIPIDGDLHNNLASYNGCSPISIWAGAQITV